MDLIIGIDVAVVAWLCAAVFRKGFEGALPLTAFFLLLFPNQSQLQVAGLFDFTTQRIVIITLFGLYLLKGRAERQESEKEPLPLRYLVILVMVWMVISSANSVVPDVSFKTTLSQFFDYFVPFYIYAKTVSKVETIHRILFAFAAAMLVCSVFGALEAYGGWSVVSLFPSLPGRFGSIGVVSDRGIRAASTFGHAILFGGTLAMAIPMALYLAGRAATLAQKTVLWAGLMLMFLNIYKSGSRGPWMALILSLGLLLVLGRGPIRKYLLVVALLTVTVLVARPGVRESLSNTYAATQDPDSPAGESYQWRYTLYHLATRELQKDAGRALWGYGPESFYYLGLTTQFTVDGEVHSVRAESCDSSVAALMTETGYVGLILTMLLLVAPARFALQSFRKLAPPDNALCLVFLANLGAFYFLMTNVAIYGWGQQNYMLWIIIALTMIYPGLQIRENLSELAVTGNQECGLPALSEAVLL